MEYFLSGKKRRKITYIAEGGQSLENPNVDGGWQAVALEGGVRPPGSRHPLTCPDVPFPQ